MPYLGVMPRGMLKDGIGPRLILSNIFFDPKWFKYSRYLILWWLMSNEYKSRQKLFLHYWFMGRDFIEKFRVHGEIFAN